jgi:hypothetical protein
MCTGLAGPYFLQNHPRVVVSALKNLSNCSPTFRCPAGDSCVPSFSVESPCSHENPSARLAAPAAHRYGPQLSHGALTGPLAGSKFRSAWPLICFSMSHLTEKPDSSAYGSGFRRLLA